MTTVRDKLHDRVDRREELAEAARDIAKRTVKENIAEALTATETFEQALTLLAALVAKALDEHTTKAVRIGAALARARGRKH